MGTKYNEIETWLFLYQFEDFEPGLKFPNDIKLPQGTLAQVRLNEESPDLARKEDGALI